MTQWAIKFRISDAVIPDEMRWYLWLYTKGLELDQKDGNNTFILGHEDPFLLCYDNIGQLPQTFRSSWDRRFTEFHVKTIWQKRKPRRLTAIFKRWDPCHSWSIPYHFKNRKSCNFSGVSPVVQLFSIYDVLKYEIPWIYLAILGLQSPISDKKVHITDSQSLTYITDNRCVYASSQ